MSQRRTEKIVGIDMQRKPGASASSSSSETPPSSSAMTTFRTLSFVWVESVWRRVRRLRTMSSTNGTGSAASAVSSSNLSEIVNHSAGM